MLAMEPLGLVADDTWEQVWGEGSVSENIDLILAARPVPPNIRPYYYRYLQGEEFCCWCDSDADLQLGHDGAEAWPVQVDDDGSPLTGETEG